MDRDWLVLPEDVSTIKCHDAYTKLLEIMDRLEEERGYRFTDEQADAVQKLITALIDNIRAFKNSRKR